MGKGQRAAVGWMVCLVVLVGWGDALAGNNPIISDGLVNDCDVLTYNGEYYITGNWIAGDMLYSRDLRNWGQRRHIFSWTNSWYQNEYPDNPDMAIHDCHLRYHDGTFHLYCQLGAEITHAVAEGVWGPYAEVSVSSPFSGRIGAEVFRDDDGRFYFYPTRFNAGNQIYVRPMADLWNFMAGTGYALMLSTSEAWEGGTPIIEGAKVFKYRGRYYMLYNAYHTRDPEYCFGCAESDSATGFSNAGKYHYPVLNRKTWPGTGEINTIGQPWLVEGLNGFERWVGYFAKHNGMFFDGRRRQSIDRAHFFDRRLYVEGPSSPYATGYHPGPALPQFRGLFNEVEGPLGEEDWAIRGGGQWAVTGGEAVQSAGEAFTMATIERDWGRHYLVEGNVRIDSATGKAGVVAYWGGADDWLIVGLDRGARRWYWRKREGGAEASATYPWAIDYGAYHKIRVAKNAGGFEVLIDDMLPPGYGGAIVTGFEGSGIAGVYADHSQAAFDGVLYTIGWDEYDGHVRGWEQVSGAWSVGPDGLEQAAATGEAVALKGDAMERCQLSVQVYGEGAGAMGIYAVYVDGENWLRAEIDFAGNELEVTGRRGQWGYAETAAVGEAGDYNVRAVRLSDRVILFVDGREVVTVEQGWPAGQVGLVTRGMAGRFNGIMAYRTEAASEEELVMEVGFEGGFGDGSGYDVEAAEEGGPVFGDGCVGRAVSFDGVDDCVAIPRVVQYDFSIACWVRTTQAGPASYAGWWDGVGLVDGDVPGAAYDYGLVMLDGKAGFGVFDDTMVSTTAINDGKWHHVAVTREMRSGVAKLYVDGRQEGLLLSICNPLVASERLMVGGGQQGGRRFAGEMDELRIYERVLSGAEIAEESGRPGVCQERPRSDLTGDCRVDLADLAFFFDEWLTCSLLPASVCP